MGFCVVSLLIIQGIASFFFNTHRSRKIFRIQLIDYMENTMRARLENEYFNQEATQQYQMEYFEEEDRDQAAAVVEREEAKEAVKNQTPPVSAAKQQSKWSGSEIRDLLTSLIEEIQIDKDIEKKQQELTDQAASERAQLFEEILREYI